MPNFLKVKLFFKYLISSINNLIAKLVPENEEHIFTKSKYVISLSSWFSNNIIQKKIFLLDKCFSCYDNSHQRAFPCNTLFPYGSSSGISAITSEISQFSVSQILTGLSCPGPRNQAQMKSQRLDAGASGPACRPHPSLHHVY